MRSTPPRSAAAIPAEPLADALRQEIAMLTEAALRWSEVARLVSYRPDRQHALEQARLCREEAERLAGHPAQADPGTSPNTQRPCGARQD